MPMVKPTLIHPLTDDIRDFFAIERFVSQQVIDNRSQGGPMIFSIE